ncbi:MAG: hypothetical protein GEU99_13930 [Luteitalea sp.]|nr:hypothetical protein [Luteitalea sp.]
MQVEQATWTQATGCWDPAPPGTLGADADLVLLFGDTALLHDRSLLDRIWRPYRLAHFMGCSTAGEIAGTRVLDGALVVTALQLEHGYVKGSRIAVDDDADSREAGARLARSLDTDGLRHVFVLSEGLGINGTDLVRGLTRHLPQDVTVTGGLSGDGTRFQETFVLWDGPPERRAVAALGIYGRRVRIGCGSLGGWDPFGPERLITKSAGNVLYELDGKSALELYTRYLGEHASGLPATGLLFPLSLRTTDRANGVVRTILSVNEREQSLTFAGDVPFGSYARLMKANVDRLIDGAIGAAKTSYEAIGSLSPDLAILISCVGRKLVLKQRIEEEVEGVRDVLGARTVLAGFYSYGEIAPFTPRATCELHNQTMTITTIAEESW